jgi:hypothetical protein
VGVSTSTAGQDFGVHAAALFAKPSDSNKEDDDHNSDTQSNHGSGIPDLDCVDPGSEILSQDWNIDLLERSFATMQDGGDGGGGSPDGSKDGSKEIKVRLCFILADCGRDS